MKFVLCGVFGATIVIVGLPFLIFGFITSMLYDGAKTGWTLYIRFSDWLYEGIE